MNGEPDQSAQTPPAPPLDYASPEGLTHPRPLFSGPVRFAAMVAGVVLPLICFALALAGSPLGPTWQSGRFNEQVGLLLSGRVAWPFFPFLLYSMGCMFVVCVEPVYAARSRVCRLGIYTGALMAAQFCVVLAGAASSSAGRLLVLPAIGMAAIAIPVALCFAARFLIARFGRTRVSQVCIAAFLVIAVAMTLIEPVSVPGSIFGAFFISLVLAPPWALGIYGWVSILMWRIGAQATARGAPDEPIAIVWPAGWAVAYAASWTLAIEQAVGAYRALPTTPPPGCYVATAAARGHRRFVRTQVLGGMAVNDQLRRLKVGELALAGIAPRLHATLRKVYDRVGPVLASALVTPILADAAYVLLKPAEWSTAFVLRRLLRNFDALAASLYLGRAPAPAEKDRT
jgi:hypothetical protein